MTDKPILFSGPMVRAILEGRKTQTRRVLNLPKKSFSGGPIYEHPKMGGWEPTILGGGGCFRFGKSGEKIPAPETVGIWHQTTGVAVQIPIQPRDRLWLRETWKLGLSDHQCAGYQADMQYQCGKPIHDGPHRWRPSMFMPRWASRITLLVTDVRVQRLQDISEEDAKAEGIFATDFWREEHPPSICFSVLWDSINAKRPGCSWADNPWVAAITFTPVFQNIDAIEATHD
jgi:hypothetical protein